MSSEQLVQPLVQPLVQQPVIQRAPITDAITISSIYYNVKPFIVYPTRWLAILLLLILRPLLATLRWLASPFISLASGAWAIVTLPVAIYVKLEAFITFFCVAVIIGAIAGIALYATSRVSHKVLGIQRSDDEDEHKYERTYTEDPAVRTVADFREARKVKKEKKEQSRKLKVIRSPREEKMFQDMLARVDYKSDYKSGASDSGMRDRLSLSVQTILEEDDSSSFEET